MKIKVSIISRLASSLASLAMLAACQQQEITPDIIDNHYPDDGVVRIANVLHAAPTRGTTDGTTNYPGTNLGLSIHYNNDQRYTSLNRLWNYTSGEWTPELQMLWKDATTPLHLYAYAPFANIGEDVSQLKFTVSDQQNNDGIISSDLVGYTKSDFLPKTDLDVDGKIALPMTHKLAKLNVRLSYGNQWGNTPPAVTSVAINETRLTGTYNATTATFLGVDAMVATESISMYVNNVPALGENPAYTQYEAIILPQEVASGAALVQIELADNSSYSYTLTANRNFISGTETAINLRIGKDEVKLDGNITVKPWLDATDDKTGDSEEDIAFPDRNFVNYLHETGGVTLDAFGEIDVTNSDVLAQLKQITHIDIKNKAIKSLKGVEYLTALINLDCSGNLLTSLQLSNHTQLQNLKCDNNRLTTLILYSLSKLTDLDCSNNALHQLKVAELTALQTLFCSNNQLATLDVSDLTQLDLGTLSCGSQTNNEQNILTLTYGNNAPGTTFNADNNPGVTAVESQKEKQVVTN